MNEKEKGDIAVAPIRPGSKDVRVVKVVVETAACHREQQFPVGDPKRECHDGLKALDFNKCPNCVWFGFRPPATTKMLTGGEAMAVQGVLETLKHTHDPMVPIKPDVGVVLDVEPGV